MDENSAFSRALKNPFVALGLCAMAGMAVYNNLMETTSDFIPSVLMDAAAPFLGETQSATTPTLQGHDAEATQWIQNPQRDPFAPAPVWAMTDASASQPSKTSSEKNRESQSALQQFELKAIALDSQERSAVINRSVVYEGEMINGYQVVAIEVRGVWLKRRGKKHLLTFKTLTTS